MGLMEDLGNSLAPQAEKINQTLNMHGWLLQERLQRLENRISDLGRPDVGDWYFKRTILGEFAEGENELFTADVGEFLAVQFMTINGLTLKTPAFKIMAGGAMILAFAKEGIGQETVGGDIMILPGERVGINMSVAGKVEATLGLTRILKNRQELQNQTGPSDDLLAAVNTHEVGRDVIMSKDGQWDNTDPDIIDSGGRPSIAR